MKKSMLLMSLCAAAGLASAAEINYDTPEKWSLLHPRFQYQPEAKEEGVLSVSGSKFLYSEPAVQIAKDKKYRFSGSFRKSGTAPAMLHFGLAFYDEKGRDFDLANSNAVPNSDTELIEEAKKGDTSFLIKDGEGWKKFKHCVIALNTKPDYSDLPNFKLIRIPIQSVEQQEGSFKVTLNKPLAAAIPAGTKVRLHMPGGTFYVAANRKLSADWLKFESRVLSRITDGPGLGNKGLFPRGTKTFRLLIIANLGLKNEGVVEFKEVKLIEE